MTSASTAVGIRSATAGDAARIARIYVECWRSAYAGILPDKLLRNLDLARHEAYWGRVLRQRERLKEVVYVADLEEDGVVGFANAGPCRDSSQPYTTEVYTLYVRDSHQGLGIGRILFSSISGTVRNRFGDSLIVWCLSDNQFRHFYEHLGGTKAAVRTSCIGGATLEETGYAWVGGAHVA